MPYRWTRLPDDAEELQLWPHRSLPPAGFALFILTTFVLLLVPLFPLLGTKALWIMLPFVLAPLALVWIFLRRSYRDGELREVLTLTKGRVRLVRRAPDGATQDWEANPYWVRIERRPGPVEAYLVLTGGPCEVEIGAFLSPEERETLEAEIESALSRAAGYGAPGR